MESPLDPWYLADGIPMSRKIGAQELLRYVQPTKGGQSRVLEIGSREVTGLSTRRQQFVSANTEYVGFDYYPGRNVDVVGDVHRLSSYFNDAQKFDIIYTFACFEHFAMPWIAAVEISKMLKIGGVLLVETHFSYATHERPWNFFQFSDMGLRVLFSEALGFECLDAGMSNPIVGRFSSLAEKYLQYQPIRGLYCGSEYLGRKVREVQSFDWNQVSLDQVVSGTTYPPPAQ